MYNNFCLPSQLRKSYGKQKSLNPYPWGQQMKCRGKGAALSGLGDREPSFLWAWHLLPGVGDREPILLWFWHHLLNGGGHGGNHMDKWILFHHHLSHFFFLSATPPSSAGLQGFEPELFRDVWYACNFSMIVKFKPLGDACNFSHVFSLCNSFKLLGDVW